MTCTALYHPLDCPSKMKLSDSLILRIEKQTHLSPIGAGLHAAVVLAVLLCGEVVRVAVATVERVRLAGSGGGVVVPASDSWAT